VSQSRSADATPSEALAAQRTAGQAPASRNRRVAYGLIAMVAIPAVLALALTGLWVTGAARSAQAYGRVSRLAALGQQVAGLAQAMADERSGAAAFISGGRAAGGLPALDRQYAITDGWAARVRRLVSGLGHGYPAQSRAGAAQVLASIAKLPGLRQQATRSQASALAVITGYSAAASGLFPAIDGIADRSGNSTLITSVRALGSLARMTDHASQQQAILAVALAGRRFGPGMLAALTTAQAQQASDLASFRNWATPQESWALTQTLGRPPASQAQAVERRSIAAGNGALALGPDASRQWSAGMSSTVGWMGRAEQQLAGWTTAEAQALRHDAMRSAMTTGGAGLGALALVVLGAVLAARPMRRRPGRHDTAALEGVWASAPTSADAPVPGGAGAHLPASAVSTAFFRRNHSLLERLLRLIDSVELNEDDPERLARLFEMDHLATRIWHNSDSALVLAGYETPRPAEPMALVDVLRAAMSEIEEYGRVILDVQHGVCVSESAATDTVHLLAELLENATTFSPETAQVHVSGHAVAGGGSLITIADGGTGMQEEELALLNERLASPSLADMAVARDMGLFAVALLAARHGITVTLAMSPDGGTTAEVHLPAELISPDPEPFGWQGRAAGVPLAGAGTEAGDGVAGLPFSAVRFASGPEPPLVPEADAPEAAPLMLGAPLPSPVPGAFAGVPGPGLTGEEPGGEPPIFESVRSGYPHDAGRRPFWATEQQAEQSPTGWPAGPPASWGDGNDGAAAGPPPPSPGLPQHGQDG
jgi:signal transduction histidine kinase